MAEGKGRSEGQGLKLLYLRDYFYKETSKDHQKDIDQIIAFLDSQNIRASDKTLYSDFRQLRDKLNVPIKYDGRTRKYYVTDPLYNGHELALLMDCVCNSPSVTKEDALRLMQIIKGLANVADLPMLAQRIEEYEDKPQTETSVLHNLNLLEQAIQQKRKVMFQRIGYVAEHTKHTEVLPYYIIASPQEITRSDEGYALHYVVELCDLPEEERLNCIAFFKEKFGEEYFEKLFDDEFYRSVDVSRLTNLKILTASSKRYKYADIVPDEETVRRHREEFEKVRAITIRFSNIVLKEIVQELGKDAVLIDTDDYHFKTTVKRELNEEFYRWLSRFGNYAKILSPQDGVDGYLEWCRRRLLEQEVLYRYDVESFVTSIPFSGHWPSSRNLRIIAGATTAKWKFDYQEIGFNSTDKTIEVHLPDHYDNSDEYDEDGNYIGDD